MIEYSQTLTTHNGDFEVFNPVSVYVCIYRTKNFETIILMNIESTIHIYHRGEILFNPKICEKFKSNYVQSFIAFRIQIVQCI